MGYLTRTIIFLVIFACNMAVAFADMTYKNSSNQNLFFKTDQDIKVKLYVSPADIKTFNKTVQLLNKRDWSEALSWADSIKSENLKDAMVEYVLWKKYTNLSQNSAETEFDNLLNFIIRHQYLPNIRDLKVKAENMYINNNIPYQFAEKYFNTIDPINTRTAIRVLKDKHSLAANKNDPKLINEITSTFHDYDFSNDELVDFMAHFDSYLNEQNYAKKVENLLWDKKFDDAKLLMGRLSNENRILYSGIIEINKNPKYINNILRSIPKNLRENELLLYTRLVYKHKNKNSKDVVKMLLELKKETSHPAKWWVYQKYYARELMKDKDYKKSYFLSINNNLKKGTADYSEAEWMAGWIALTFLNKPKDAYYHFYNMYNAVSYPISKSRGAYWAGRAMEADKNTKEAVNWYNIAAQYPLYFYGQLSYHAKNELLGIPSLADKNPLPDPPKFTKEEETAALENNIVKIAYLMAKCGGNRNDYTNLFMTAINSAKTKGEISAIFEIIKNTEDEILITKLAKHLTYKDVYFVDNLFPVLNIINTENPNSHLIHSIIKQESGFHVSAKSRVGATGFMQLMPATAKEVCKRMKIKYNNRLLKTNPAYNILLGSYYINSLIKRFNGSQILAIASYNAGAVPVNRWIKDYGDPRDMKHIKDIVNWIESIGYSETRNYVQRIVEGSIVYEYILEKSNPVIKNPDTNKNANNK